MLPRKIPVVLIAALLPAFLAASPGASAQLPQLPPGVSVPDADLNQSFSVPAGTTTSVDLGVPVQVDYRQNGWVVVANGTSVSVTAPAGASEAAVPVSYAGYNATITLVSEPEKAPEPPAAPTAPVVTSERPPASPVDAADAERLDFDAEIRGNVLRVQLGLLEAANLYNRFRDTSQDGLKVRYVDTDGGIISGVQRDIDPAARTLTLTYPEGRTPDNPFIIELIRDNEVAEVIVTLTAPGATVEQSGDTGDTDATVGRSSELSSSVTEGSSTLMTILGAGLAMLVVGTPLAVGMYRRHRR